MNDDLPHVPSRGEPGLGDPELERELRALFAPTPAPRAFRERLKAELRRDAEPLVLVEARPRMGDLRSPHGVRTVLLELAGHRRATALISAALLAAAALLLATSVGTVVPLPHSAVFAPAATATSRPARAPGYRPIPPAGLATPRPVPTTSAHRPPAKVHRRSVTIHRSPGASHRPVSTHRAATSRSVATAAPWAHRSTRAPGGLQPHTGVPTVTNTPMVAATAPGQTAQAASTPTTPSVPSPAPTTPAPASRMPATATRVSLPASTATRVAQAVATATHVAPARVATHAPPGATLVATGTPVPPPATATATAIHGSHATTATSARTPRRKSAQHARLPTLPPLGIGVLLTPYASATATPRPPATATALPATPTRSATPAPTATATPDVVRYPLAQPQLPVPGPANGVLSSPLSGTLTVAQQPVSYSVASSLTLPPPVPATLYGSPPMLPVYPLVRSSATLVDALAIAQQIGAKQTTIISGTQGDGSVQAAVQVDGKSYLLTVYSGYNAPWFTLRALTLGTGHLWLKNQIPWADTWLRDHHLAHADLRPLASDQGSITYGQTAAGVALLGPNAVQISFDGNGNLRELRYEYIPTTAVMPAPAESPNLAASAAVEGQGLYQGPSASTVTGAAAISNMALVYVGVHGVRGDYLEPVYALNGDVPAAQTTEGFSLYVPALQWLPPPLVVSH